MSDEKEKDALGRYLDDPYRGVGGRFRLGDDGYLIPVEDEEETADDVLASIPEVAEVIRNQQK